jgi:Flp pilus assembly protein TadG
MGGQSFLEFAIALPALLILLMGMVEVALLMRAQLVLTNATREGARLASRGMPDGAVFDRAMSAFSRQLPADLSANTGIAITRFYVPGAGEPAPDVTSVYSGTGFYSTGRCKSTIGSGYWDTLVENNKGFSTRHDVAIVEACHNYDLSFIPVTRMLYDKTTMRISVQLDE